MENLLGKVDPIRLRLEVDDCLHWSHSSNGIFSVKSYRGSCWMEAEMEGIWATIWKLPLPSKVTFFIWMAVKGHLPTIDLLQHRDMLIPNACYLCLYNAGSIDHIFIHCPYVVEIWEMFLKEIGLSWVFPSSIASLIASWNISRVYNKGCSLWKLVCPTVCWLIWLECNKRVFEGSMEPKFNIFCRAKELTCFWGINCKNMGNYSPLDSKREWGSLFLCILFLVFCFVVCSLCGFLIPFLLMKL